MTRRYRTVMQDLLFMALSFLGFLAFCAVLLAMSVFVIIQFGGTTP